MIQVLKETYNPKTFKKEYEEIGTAKTYKEAIEKFNGVQGWWMKKEHTFFIGRMWGEVCIMKKI